MLFRSMKDQVYDYISNEIACGKLAADTEISESALCTALNVSRTPVREALMQLAHNGYIEHIPRRGFFTRSLTQQKAANLLQIIGILEGAAAALAIESGKLDFHALRSMIADMSQSIQHRDLAAFHAQQATFHATINKASGNDEMVRMIEMNKKYFMHDQYISSQPNDETLTLATQMNAGHEKIVNLLEAKRRDELVSYLIDEHWNPRNAKYHAYN